MLKQGQIAPLFSLPDQDGNIVKLKDLRGNWVILYFYPKDDTPGCTKEACTFRDNLPKFKKIKAVILGISVDSVKSHKKFSEKYGLPFTILADEHKKAVEQYGVWMQKSMYGRTYWGTARMSFLINPAGKVAKVYERVKPEQHPEEVLHDLKILQS